MKFSAASAREFVLRHRQYFLAFFIYLIIALVMFWNITGNSAGTVVNGGGDVYQSLWNLWWTPFATFVLHQSPYITNYILFPVGANLATQTMTPLAGILTWPLQLVSLAFAYNVLFFTSFALGGLFMYMLAKYIVKNPYAAFIAGLIFAFSPMHIAQSYSHLQWTIIEFIPLFTLFFIMALRERKRRYAILAGISFVLLSFMGDIEQSMIVITFAVVSLVLFAIMERKQFLTRKTLEMLVIMGVVAAVVSLPFLLAIQPYLNANALNGTGYLTDVPHNMLYSDTLAGFLLPSYYNGVFNGASLSYYNQTYGLVYNQTQYQPDPSEKVSYLGYTVIALALLGIFYELKLKKNRRETAYWVAIFIVFALLALGPFIQISGTINTGIPSIYNIYKAIPLFNTVREPGRFDVIATMALAVLAALGIKHLHDVKQHTDKHMLRYCVLFAALILIEYNGMPLSTSFAHSLQVNATIPAAYPVLSRVSGNFSLLILPALPNQYTGYVYPGQDMLYATAVKHQLVGGYPTRSNLTQEYDLEDVPLVDIANYAQSGQGIIFPYPIDENYSALTALWLAEYGTQFVSVTRDAFTPAAYSQLTSYIQSFLGAPIYQDNNGTVFQTNGAAAQAGHSVTAYIIGTWVPGYAFCEGAAYCNTNFSDMWWGSPLRAATVLVPSAQTINMTFEALSYYQEAPLYVFLNGQEVEVLNVTNETAKPQVFNIPLNMSKGFNQVEFYESNATLQQENPYWTQEPDINYGLRNITFT